MEHYTGTALPLRLPFNSKMPFLIHALPELTINAIATGRAIRELLHVWFPNPLRDCNK